MRFVLLRDQPGGGTHLIRTTGPSSPLWRETGGYRTEARVQARDPDAIAYRADQRVSAAGGGPMISTP
jgi:hypothetical protein